MLTGKHVGLRAVEPTDLAQLMDWRNKPELRQFFREYRELNSENQKKWFEQTVLGDRSVLMFSIIELKTGRLLGACGLCYINWVYRNADFSVYIGADGIYLDDVLAIDTAHVLIDYAFNQINLHRVWAEVYDFDKKKNTFFKSLGFQLDGVFRETYWLGGKWHNSNYWSLLSTDTKARDICE